MTRGTSVSRCRWTEAALPVWRRASVSVELPHHGLGSSGVSSRILLACVPLHLHAGDVTPRSPAPVGRLP